MAACAVCGFVYASALLPYTHVMHARPCVDVWLVFHVFHVCCMYVKVPGVAPLTGLCNGCVAFPDPGTYACACVCALPLMVVGHMPVCVCATLDGALSVYKRNLACSSRFFF